MRNAENRRRLSRRAFIYPVGHLSDCSSLAETNANRGGVLLPRSANSSDEDKGVRHEGTRNGGGGAREGKLVEIGAICWTNEFYR